MTSFDPVAKGEPVTSSKEVMTAKMAPVVIPGRIRENVIRKNVWSRSPFRFMAANSEGESPSERLRGASQLQLPVAANHDHYCEENQDRGQGGAE